MDLSQSLFDTYVIDDQEVSFEMDVDEMEMDVDTIIPLGLIVNELISNALKHAFDKNQKGSISLSLKQKSDGIELKVSDDGKGIGFNEIPKSNKSLGMDLVKSFVKKLKGDLQILNGKGTTFIISINNLPQVKTA